MPDKYTRSFEIYQSLFEGTEFPIKGAANKYTSVNGNMFSFLTKEGDIALRISKEEREEFLQKYPKSVVISYDTVMKDYVSIPADILKNRSALEKLFVQSCEHARSLKPKPTIRKKK